MYNVILIKLTNNFQALLKVRIIFKTYCNSLCNKFVSHLKGGSSISDPETLVAFGKPAKGSRPQRKEKNNLNKTLSYFKLRPSRSLRFFEAGAQHFISFMKYITPFQDGAQRGARLRNRKSSGSLF